MHKSNLRLVFRIGHCQGTMSLLVHANDKLVLDQPAFGVDSFELDIATEFPCRLQFAVGNKGTTDTQIDSNGTIIADKCIVLEKLLLGQVEIPTHQLQSICQYTTDNGVKYDNYWGSNGEVTIDFDTQSSVEWHLRALIK